MEQRHYLTLARLAPGRLPDNLSLPPPAIPNPIPLTARQHGEDDLAKKLTDVNHFHVRLTNMVRSMDPTSKVFLAHYDAHYKNGSLESLADLIVNIVP